MDGLKLIRQQDTQDADILSVTDEVTRARNSVQVNYPNLKTRLDAIDTNADIIQNNINQIISGLQWKASVTTFNELANVYPNPQEGWTVSVNDTNYVYRFDADTNQWQPISANSIGVAIPNGANGLMTGTDKAKLDGLNANDYVKKTGDTITGNLTVTGNINGNLNGNSSSATRLQISRKINGTDFDGSADIITEKWGEVRNIQIGNSIKQVDGSQNINFALNDIGASPANHNHDNDYLKLSGGTLTGVLNANGGVVGNLQGNSTTATRLQNARDIKIGNATKRFDGTGNIEFTLQDIGASPLNHNHDNAYLKLTGGTLTGNVNTNSSVNFTTANSSGIRFNNNLILRNNGTSTVISSINNTMYFRPQGDTNGTNQMTLGTNGDLTATRFVGPLQGNATSATRLETPRRINGVEFDGTRDINIGINAGAINLNGYVKPSQGGALNPNDTLNQAFGKIEVNLDGKANANHTHNYAGSNSVGGPANTALRLQTARTIQLTGAITGQANFDGSTNIQINTTLATQLKNRLVRQRNSVTVNATTNNVAIGINGFNTNNDVLNVYLSGVRLDPVVDYTFTATTVTLTGNKQFIIGDVVSFEVIQLA